MEKIALNEIPRWSPWPARLLGLEPWTPPHRDTAKVESEYNLDKYAKCLAFHQGGPGRGPDEVKDFEFGGTGADPLAISLGPDLVVVPRDDARRRYYDLLSNTMGPAIERAATVVELGCGYGYNLWMLRQRFGRPRYLGGEFSANAVQLAGLLHAATPEVSVRRFNYYESDFGWVVEQPGPLVVFTSHSVEQIPSFAPVLRRLAGACRGRDVTVFHFEPVTGLHDDSLLGLLRRRYADVNDYNRDLGEAVRTTPHVRLRRSEADVFGLNPFNPTSVLEWVPEG